MFCLLCLQRKLFGIWLLVSFGRKTLLKGFEIHLKAVRLPTVSIPESLHRFAGEESRLEGFRRRCLRIALKGHQPVREAVPEGKTAPSNERTTQKRGRVTGLGFVGTGGFHKKALCGPDPGSKQQDQVV